MANCLNFGKRYEDDNQYFQNPVPFRIVELHQVGELCCEAGYDIPKHPQIVWEITYIVTGKATVLVDDRPVQVEEDDVIISAPGQTHAIRADRGTPLRFCYLGFMFTGRQAAELDRQYRALETGAKTRCKEMLSLFSLVFDELKLKNDFYLTMVGSYIEQIVMRTGRVFRERAEGQPMAVSDGRGGSAAHAVARHIDRHYREIEDIRSLAAELGYSYTYLAHIFKEKIGITIGSYIIMKKMNEAKWLLRSGRMNVSQIAARFNYHSVQSFSNSFKKAVGISPADYQALSPQDAERYNGHL